MDVVIVWRSWNSCLDFIAWKSWASMNEVEFLAQLLYAPYPTQV